MQQTNQQTLPQTNLQTRQEVSNRLRTERLNNTLARRGNFILIRDTDPDEEKPFIVCESSPEQWEKWGCASYGQRFQGIGQAALNLLTRSRSNP